MFPPRELFYSCARGPGVFFLDVLSITRFWLIVVALLMLAQSVFAEGSAPVQLRKDVAQPLQQAQDAMRLKNPGRALELAQQVLTLPELTSQERQYSLRIAAAAANAMNQWTIVANMLKELLQFPDLPATDRLIMSEALLNSLWQLQDHVQYISTARAYLQINGTNASVFTRLLRSLAAKNEHLVLINEVNMRVTKNQVAGQKSEEVDLVLMAQAQRQLKDDAGYVEALFLLVSQFPNKARWNEVIRRIGMMPNFNPRLELDIYRLLEKTGNLIEVTDFQEMAGLATKVGLPCEAQRVLQLGIDSGVLGRSAEFASRDAAQKQCSVEANQLTVLMRSARDGNAMKAVADVYGSQQDWVAASSTYAKALSLGSLRRPDELHLHYAITLFLVGRKEDARKQLAQVTNDVSIRQITRLWAMLGYQL